MTKPKFWRSLDHVSESAKREHLLMKHENPKLPGEPWMMCDEPLCQEYRIIFDETDVLLTRVVVAHQKSRERRNK